jgi:hypothetical protein
MKELSFVFFLFHHHSPYWSKYPPRPSVPKFSVKVICTFRTNWREKSGSNTRLLKRSTVRFSISSLPVILHVFAYSK